jgi:hypothetical protein
MQLTRESEILIITNQGRVHNIEYCFSSYPIAISSKFIVAHYAHHNNPSLGFLSLDESATKQIVTNHYDQSNFIAAHCHKEVHHADSSLVFGRFETSELIVVPTRPLLIQAHTSS